MPRKSKPPPDDPAESKRFIDMARELGADESDKGREAFERAFDRIVIAGRESGASAATATTERASEGTAGRRHRAKSRAGQSASARRCKK